MQKITTFLWFDSQAEEAANFYVSLFKDGKIKSMMHYGAAGPGQPGSVMAVIFHAGGHDFMALNGGPLYNFTPAISLFVKCETQREIDELWAKLTADGGEPVQCGWLTDRYGLSWQIVPAELNEMLTDKDETRSQRVFQAMLNMVKLDIAALERAYRGEDEAGGSAGGSGTSPVY